MSRYYPGFLAAFFIVLLRIAIGWHFLYEGCDKVQANLRAARNRSRPRSTCGTRPGRSRRISVECCRTSNGRGLLDLAKLKDRVEGRRERIADHSDSRTTSATRPRRCSTRICSGPTTGLTTPRTPRRSRSIPRLPTGLGRPSGDPQALSYQKERAWEARRSLEADRRSLIQPLLDQEKGLREAVAKLATPEQVAAGGRDP